MAQVREAIIRFKNPDKNIRARVKLLKVTKSTIRYILKKKRRNTLASSKCLKDHRR